AERRAFYPPSPSQFGHQKELIDEMIHEGSYRWFEIANQLQMVRQLCDFAAECRPAFTCVIELLERSRAGQFLCRTGDVRNAGPESVDNWSQGLPCSVQTCRGYLFAVNPMISIFSRHG